MLLNYALDYTYGMTKKYAVEGLMGYPNELAHMLDKALEQNAALLEVAEDLIDFEDNSCIGDDVPDELIEKARQAIALGDKDGV